MGWRACRCLGTLLRYIGVRTRPVRGLLPRPRVAHDRPVRHGRRRWPAAARRVGGRSRVDDRWIRIRSIIESAREGGRKARARGRCDAIDLGRDVATSRGRRGRRSTHRRRGARQTRARALGAEDNPVHACVVRISPPVARRRGIARRSRRASSSASSFTNRRR